MKTLLFFLLIPCLVFAHEGHEIPDGTCKETGVKNDPLCLFKNEADLQKSITKEYRATKESPRPKPSGHKDNDAPQEALTRHDIYIETFTANIMAIWVMYGLWRLNKTDEWDKWSSLAIIVPALYAVASMYLSGNYFN